MILDSHSVEEFNKVRPDKNSAVLCHAPFKSIFFGMSGKLYACCFNRIYILGTYPEQTIREIWFGEKTNALRKAIRQHDLSLGCYTCGYMLAAKNYEGVAIKNFDYTRWDEAGYPTKMDFELSNICNLECIMCRGEHSSSIRQNREKRPPIPPKYDSEFIRQLEEFIPHLQTSHFLGGEPFLIPIYLDLWEKMLELNPTIEISVQTNATVVNERISRILEAMPFSISVSIDSIDKNIYEQIRVNARFERVMENTRFFRNYCQRKGKKMTISYCPMVMNWHELPEVVEFCNDLNVDVFFNTVMLPVKYSLSSLSQAEMENIISFLEKKHLPEETEVQKQNKKSFESVINQIRYWRQQASRKEKIFNGHRTITGTQEFLKMLRDYIDGTFPGSPEKQAMYADIEDKINFMFRRAEQEGILNEFRDYVFTSDPVLVCDFLPKSGKEHFYNIIKIHAGLQ
ncbi:MAG TPA: radical SAM protein [Chitinophagales bacterium]|nr:radical SAM protein [Chitinophagales bacterium]